MSGLLVMLTFACSLASFFICAIPSGLLIASALSGVDVRDVGSGNIGMTNVARSAGGKAAALTFLCDAGKGTLSMCIARWVLTTFALGGDQSPITPTGHAMACVSCVYAACVLGHIFTPYLRFHGGKGISVGFGAGLGLWWPVGLGMLAVFLLVTIPTRYVSAGSICAAASLPIQCALWGMRLAALIPVLVVALVVIWAHRENIGRLRRGEERTFSVLHSGH